MTAERDRSNASLDIVYFANVDWQHTWQRSQHIASRLAGYGRVLYIDPPGLRAPRPSDVFRLLARLRRSKHRAVSDLVVSRALPCWPSVRQGAMTRLGGWRLRRIARRWMHRENGRPPVLWASHPSPIVLAATRGLPRSGLVYDAVDRFSAFHPKNARCITEAEQAIARSADVVLTVSEELHRDLSPANPRAYLVPNAVEFAHFSHCDEEKTPPADLSCLPRPLLGYVGEIASWLDLGILEKLSRSGVCASIALIGPAASDRLRQIRKWPNVHWLGRKSYADLPRYMSRFDVGLIPFRLTPLTVAASPIKLFEYLACGCPVVSTPLPAVMPHKKVVHIAEPEGFVSLVAEALNTARNSSLRKLRIDVARANDWRFRIERILEIFRRHGIA
jgi:glycosyltransferase involved in cell wall biosynthesis